MRIQLIRVLFKAYKIISKVQTKKDLAIIFMAFAGIMSFKNSENVINCLDKFYKLVEQKNGHSQIS